MFHRLKDIHVKILCKTFYRPTLHYHRDMKGFKTPPPKKKNKKKKQQNKKKKKQQQQKKTNNNFKLACNKDTLKLSR